MTHVLIKLITGEEIIGESVDSSIGMIDGKIVITEPKQIYWGMESNRVTARLFPFMMYSEEKTFTINENHVITYTTKVTKELIDNYKSSFVKNKISDAESAVVDFLKNMKPHSIN